jgi:RHS repeat-associated protein
MCRGSPGNNYKIDRNVSPPQVTQVSRTEHAPQPVGSGPTGSCPTNGSLAPANLLGYTGALTDISSGNATGYTHDGNRWYDTTTGAFTAQDTSTYLANPANGNLYAYAADNPANYIDPTGQSSCSTWIFGIGIIAGGLILGALSLAASIAAPIFSPFAYGLAVGGLGLALAGAAQLGSAPSGC